MVNKLNTISLKEFPLILNAIDPKNENDPKKIPIPANPESTIWKVCKIAVSILTFGIAPLLYMVGKEYWHITKVIYYAIYNGGDIIPSKGKTKTYTKKYSPTLAKLDKMQRLGPSDIKTFQDILSEKAKVSEKGKDVVPEYFLSANGIPTEEEFKTALNNTQSLIIPVVLKGGLFSIDHITTLIIDPQKKEIIYIDPKGKTLSDRASQDVKTELVSVSQHTATKTVKEVWDQVINSIRNFTDNQSEWKLLQNTSQHQHDGYNCGVHFLHYTQEYAEKRTITSHLDTLTKVRAERKKLIDEISEFSNSKIVKNPSKKKDNETAFPSEPSNDSFELIDS